MKTQEAEQLITTFQRGRDREASFQRLFELYTRPVFYFFTNRGFSEDEARDMMQDTFLQVFRGLGGFRQDSNFETWLFSIATNIWRNRLRSSAAEKRRGEEIDYDGNQGEVESGVAKDTSDLASNGPLEEFLAGERARILRDVLDDMPPMMRQCLLLRLDQDLKYREIAYALKISVENVKAQLYKARTRLRESLSEYFTDVCC